MHSALITLGPLQRPSRLDTESQRDCREDAGGGRSELSRDTCRPFGVLSEKTSSPWSSLTRTPRSGSEAPSPSGAGLRAEAPPRRVRLPAGKAAEGEDGSLSDEDSSSASTGTSADFFGGLLSWTEVKPGPRTLLQIPMTHCNPDCGGDDDRCTENG